jgi:predicted ATP-dependent protease
MKAKLYIFEDQFELKLSDDTVHTPGKKENKTKFLERMKEFVTNEHLDDEFEVIEIDKAVVALNDEKTLTAALEGASGLQKKLIESVLANTAKPKKEKKEKVNAVPMEEAKESAAYKAAEANIGKFASFSPFKSLEVIEGKIAGVAMNKTNTIFYYTIVEASGKRRCCGVLNESVQIIDEPEEFKKQAKAATVKETKTTSKKAKATPVVDATDADDKNLDGSPIADDLM